MRQTLDIIEQQLNVGDVKTITSNGGTQVKLVELLFSPTTKVQFAPSDDNKALRLSVSDNNLTLPELDCVVHKQTLRDLIIGLKQAYNQIEDNE